MTMKASILSHLFLLISSLANLNNHPKKAIFPNQRPLPVEHLTAKKLLIDVHHVSTFRRLHRLDYHPYLSLFFLWYHA